MVPGASHESKLVGLPALHWTYASVVVGAHEASVAEVFMQLSHDSQVSVVAPAESHESNDVGFPPSHCT